MNRGLRGGTQAYQPCSFNPFPVEMSTKIIAGRKGRGGSRTSRGGPLRRHRAVQPLRRGSPGSHLRRYALAAKGIAGEDETFDRGKKRERVDRRAAEGEDHIALDLAVTRLPFDDASFDVAARTQVDADEAAAAIIIPAGFSAGVIPAGAGTKEIMRRVIKAKALGKETGDLSALANPESVENIPRIDL